MFDAAFIPDPARDALSDQAWLQAMLSFEAALARAEANAGVIPADAAEAIAAAALSLRPDPADIGEQARLVANPAEPLVRALRSAVPHDAQRFVHLGATSQDVVDTATSLVARRALDLVAADLAAVADACAALARTHRDTLMIGRTLQQHAVPTTFGLKAAGWLAGLDGAGAQLHRVRAEALAVQLGGAAGTLSALGDHGLEVLGGVARELGLAEPDLPWDTVRGRVGELGAALALSAGALAKVALDVELLSQTEVGEVAEPSGGRRGGSSTMPHKRNPVGSVLARACAEQVQAAAGVLLRAVGAAEHERAAGAWQAEWPAVRAALGYTAGAAHAMREALEGLDVHPDRMRANLDATRGLVMAERVSLLLAERAGRSKAQELLADASASAAETGGWLGDALLASAGVREHLSVAEIAEVVDPAGYLGSAGAFVDRALERHAAGVPV